MMFKQIIIEPKKCDKLVGLICSLEANVEFGDGGFATHDIDFLPPTPINKHNGGSKLKLPMAFLVL
jgi:hypothetical protein